MGKKKNKKNKDFQKVKLKLGRKLPKGDNVTDTSFKARKIVVGQHLKASTDDVTEPLTSKKLSIKELLPRLNHYNVTVRSESLKGLKELVEGHHDIANQHSTQLIEKIPLLATDCDENVRKTTLSVIKLVLGNVSGEKLVPMYSVLAAQLSCAMSHINPYIQFDSLFFLDTLLEHCPKIIGTSSKLLLPNFVNMVSKNRSSGNEKSRMLAVDPSNKLMSNNWRKHVLLRLNKVLQILLKPESSSAFRTNKVDWKSCCHRQICTFQQSKALPHFSLKEIAKEMDYKDVVYSPSNFLIDVIPLLYESWIEVGTGRRNYLKPNELASLEIILEIFLSIVIFMKSTDDFEMKELIDEELNLKQFVEIFFNALPFADNEEVSRKNNNRKRKRDNSKDVMNNKGICNKINLTICFIVLSIGVGNDSVKPSTIEEILCSILSNMKSVSIREMELIIYVADALLIDPKQKSDGSLLVSLCAMLQCAEYSNSTYSRIVAFFRKIFESSKYNTSHELQRIVVDYVVTDLKSRNARLNEEILVAYVELFCSVLKRRSVAETKSISVCLPKLIANVNVRIHPDNCLKVAALFYWCDIDVELLDHVVILKRDRLLPKEFLCSFVQLLQIRHQEKTLTIPEDCYFEFMSALCSN